MQNSGSRRYMDIDDDNANEWENQGYNYGQQPSFQKHVNMSSGNGDVHPQVQYVNVHVPLNEISDNYYSRQYHGNSSMGRNIGRTNVGDYPREKHSREGVFMSIQRSQPYSHSRNEENWIPMSASGARFDKHHISEAEHVSQDDAYRKQSRQMSSDCLMENRTARGGLLMSQSPISGRGSQVQREMFREMSSPNMCPLDLEVNTSSPNAKYECTRVDYGHEIEQDAHVGFAGPLGHQNVKLTGAERKSKWQKENSEYQKALRFAQAKGSNAVITLRTSKSGKVIQFPTKWQRSIRELMYKYLDWGLRHFSDQSEDMVLLIIENIKNMFNYEPYPLNPESVRQYCKTHLHSCRHKWRVHWNKNECEDKKIPEDCDPRVWKQMVAYWGTMEGEKESERGKQIQEARKTKSHCGRISKRMRVEEMSSREEKNELDLSTSGIVGGSSRITFKRRKDKGDDNSLHIAKEMSIFDGEKMTSQRSIDEGFQGLKETIQQHMNEQKIEYAYIHKRIDEMYSYVKEVLEINRMHTQRNAGHIKKKPVVEMKSPNVMTVDKHNIEASEGMFCETILETQFEGEEETHDLQRSAVHMLNKGKGIGEVEMNINVLEADIPSENVMKATNSIDHENNEMTPPKFFQKNDAFMEICFVEENEHESGAQRRVSKRRVVHTEKGAQMVGNKRSTWKRPPSKKVSTTESNGQEQETNDVGENVRSKIQDKTCSGPPKKLIPVPLPCGTEVILRHFCYGSDIVARGRCVEWIAAQTNKKKDKNAQLPPGSQRVHVTEVLKPHVNLYFPNENANPPQRHLGQVLENEIVWWIKDLEIDEDG